MNVDAKILHMEANAQIVITSIDKMVSDNLKTIFVILFVIGITYSATVAFTGKTVERYYYNSTVKEVVNYSIECVPQVCECKGTYNNPPCICECTPEERKHLQLTIGRLSSELSYLKNVTANVLLNQSFDDLRNNLTECLEREIDLLDKLRKINESLGGN